MLLILISIKPLAALIFALSGEQISARLGEEGGIRMARNDISMKASFFQQSRMMIFTPMSAVLFDKNEIITILTHDESFEQI